MDLDLTALQVVIHLSFTGSDRNGPKCGMSCPRSDAAPQRSKYGAARIAETPDQDGDPRIDKPPPKHAVNAFQDDNAPDQNARPDED